MLAAGALDLAAFAHGEGQRMKRYVTGTWCGVNRDTKAPTAACTYECVKEKAAKFAFYNFADKKVYILNPQKMAAAYAGKQIILHGSIRPDTQHFSNMRGPSDAQVITASSISSFSWHW